jgi:uncharacterized protein
VDTYTLLRSPIICSKPLSAVSAVEKIDNLRRNPAYMVLDYPGPGLMDKVWAAARSSDSPRRIYDIRLGLTLRHYGLTRFTAANTSAFRGSGFKKVTTRATKIRTAGRRGRQAQTARGEGDGIDVLDTVTLQHPGS